MSDRVDCTKATATKPHLRWPRFISNRCKELAYGGLFSTVFLLSQSPLHALVIDDIRVLSKLGEPFLAEIRVAPAAGELINDRCFTALRGSGDLPRISNVKLRLTRQLNTQVLQVIGDRPVREPMSQLVLQVKCPGVPTIVRDFMVLVDPPAYAASSAVSGSVAAPAATTTLQQPTAGQTARVAVARSETGGNAIQPGSRYTVGPGDMLSTIAARVAGRPDWSVWPIAQQIYASNPGAFLLGDPNMLAQGATIYIPTLNEVDLSNTGPAAVAAATSSRSAPPQASTQNGAVAQTPPTPAAVTQNLATAPPAASAAQAAVPVVREPLPSMQITATLMSESRMKLELRRQGSPVPSVVALPESTPTSVDPNVTPEPEPIPSTTPEQPANVSEQPRVALSERSGLGWSFIGAGWLLAFLLGVLLTALVTRRRRKADDDDEFYVPEQSYRPEPATAAPVVAAPVATPTPIDFGDDDRFAGESSDASPAFNETTPTVEIPSMIDQDLGDTAEFEAYKGLDLELPHDEPARVGDPETLEMPQVAESLDLELPTTEHGETGQHDVDFDLLEQAYSDEYHAEYIAARDDETAPTAELPQPGQNDDTARFYHLENRDPADEAPLPIELGEDEMTGDSADDDNVVNFPKSSSSG